jgi:hypothetical protein
VHGEQNMDFDIVFPKSVYIHTIYRYVIPRLRKYLVDHQEDELIFNFLDVQFISPNVVPHILNIAEIIKRTTGKKLQIEFSWDTKLLSYLDKTKFFVVGKDLFEFDKRLYGGFLPYKTQDNCTLLFCAKETVEEYFAREPICHDILQYVKDHPDCSNVDISKTVENKTEHSTDWYIKFLLDNKLISNGEDSVTSPPTKTITSFGEDWFQNPPKMTAGARTEKSLDEICHTIKVQLKDNDTIKAKQIVDDTVLNFADIFSQLVRNGIYYDKGASDVYGICQIKYPSKYLQNSPGGSGKPIAFLTICDSGIAIKNSMQQDGWGDGRKPFFTLDDTSMYSFISEAIFWRHRYPLDHNLDIVHGLNIVTELVLQKRGKIGIHSHDTYLLLTSDNFLKDFLTIKALLLPEDGKQVDPGANNLKNHPEITEIVNRKRAEIETSFKYAGVHIDISFPLDTDTGTRQ